MYPYALTLEGEHTYKDYIAEHALEAAKKFIQEDDKDKLTFLVDLGVLDSDETDQPLIWRCPLTRQNYCFSDGL